MHVIDAVMVIVVTIFPGAMVVTMMVVVVVGAFMSNGFTPSSSAIVTFLFGAMLCVDLSINASISGPIQTTKSAFCKRFASDGRSE